MSGGTGKARPVPLHSGQTPVPAHFWHFGSLWLRCVLMPVPMQSAHFPLPWHAIQASRGMGSLRKLSDHLFDFLLHRSTRTRLMNGSASQALGAGSGSGASLAFRFCCVEIQANTSPVACRTLAISITKRTQVRTVRKTHRATSSSTSSLADRTERSLSAIRPAAVSIALRVVSSVQHQSAALPSSG